MIPAAVGEKDGSGVGGFLFTATEPSATGLWGATFAAPGAGSWESKTPGSRG